LCGSDPGGERADRVDAIEPLAHRPAGEEVLGHEAAERRADPLLVGGDGAGVRNRQAERAAEEGDDREPVGAGTDHAGLREGTHIGQPRPVDLGETACNEDQRHRDEQQRRDRPHAPQAGATRIDRVKGGGAACLARCR